MKTVDNRSAPSRFKISREVIGSADYGRKHVRSYKNCWIIIIIIIEYPINNKFNRILFRETWIE